MYEYIKRNNKKQKFVGFTLIEALVLLFIFALITITFYQVISLGTRYIIFSKNRLGAIVLANEKMEIARNLQYDDVGTDSEACEGDILQDEDVFENGRNYHVHTQADYVDDPFDGTLSGSPSDTAYKDYKIVKITVSWGSEGTADYGSVFLLSRFVPPGLETATSGDGILSINIFSDQDDGEAVGGAEVEIVNSDLEFSETRQTDEMGNVTIVGAQESIQKYKISVSKNDYEEAETFPPYPDTDYNPVDTHASVVAGELSVKNIILNKTANLKIKTQNYLDATISDISFNLKGGRKLGNEELYPYTAIYNLNENGQTNSSGEKEYNSISPGQYSFSLDDDVENYELIGTDPATPFSLISEQDLELKVELAAKNVTSVLVTVENSDSGSLFSGAKVELSNDSGYDEEIITNGNGTAFFPKTDDPPFIPGIYDLKITADGYQDVSKEITVDANELDTELAEMTLLPS